MNNPKETPQQQVEIRGKVSRIGVKPFDDVYPRCGYTLLLVDNPQPYTVWEDGREHRTFVELTQPGDIVSFTATEGDSNAYYFCNETLMPQLKDEVRLAKRPVVYPDPPLQQPRFRCGGCGNYRLEVNRFKDCPGCRA